MKRRSAFLLVLALLITVLPVFTVGATAEETAATPWEPIAIAADAETVTQKDGNTYTVLRDAETLKTIAANGYYILANDIDFGGEAVSAVTLENVTFDGNGNSLLNFKLEGEGNLSFFTAAGTAVTVCNVTFGSAKKLITVNATNTAADGDAGVGVVFGNVSAKTAVTLSNVNAYANVTTAASVRTGGLVGRYTGAETLSLINCNFSGSVTGNNLSGDYAYAGIIGYTGTNASVAMTDCNNYADVTALVTSGTNVKTAGFIGYIRGHQAIFRNCANFGTVQNESSNNTGGFVGQIYTGETVDLIYTFEECFNYGEIKGREQTGGFMGVFQPTKDPTISMSFVKCANYGAVSGTTLVGGMMGYFNASSATLSAGTKARLVKVTQCSNFGTVSGTGENIGGLFGRINARCNFTADSCANYADVSSTAGYVGGICGFTGTHADYEPSEYSNLLNMGNITSGSSGAGGIIGKAATARKLTLDKCINLGMITGHKDKGVGGMIGGLENTTACPAFNIKNCLSAGRLEYPSISDNSNIGYMVGLYASKVTGTVSGNYYLSIESKTATNINTVVAAEELDLDNTLKTLNNNYSETWGKFILNNDSDGFVLATPELAAVQDGNVAENGFFNIRLVATLQDTLRYHKVGFLVTVNDSTEVNDISCRHVYTKLNMTENGKLASVSAGELGGKYIYALQIKQIPADQTVKLTVTPYATDLENENETYTGVSYVLTFVNGVYTGASEVPAANS